VKLHGSVGPAQTTVRATVYRHFPDDEALFNACTAHFYARNPRPDPEEWVAIADPDQRLRVALTELYAWYGRTEAMLTTTRRDREHVPAKTFERFLAYFEGVHGTLMRGRKERGPKQARVAAAIGHAIGFTTWQSLTGELGLDDDDAIELMLGMVASVT
jgi:AcrR family transcriptional regulator